MREKMSSKRGNILLNFHPPLKTRCLEITEQETRPTAGVKCGDFHNTLNKLWQLAARWLCSKGCCVNHWQQIRSPLNSGGGSWRRSEERRNKLCMYLHPQNTQRWCHPARQLCSTCFCVFLWISGQLSDPCLLWALQPLASALPQRSLPSLHLLPCPRGLCCPIPALPSSPPAQAENPSTSTQPVRWGKQKPSP